MPTYSIETIQINYLFLTIFPTHSWLSPWAYNPTTEDNVNHNGVPTGAFCVCLASWPWLISNMLACWFLFSGSQFPTLSEVSNSKLSPLASSGASTNPFLRGVALPSSKSAQMTLPPSQKHLQCHSVCRQFKISRHLFKFSLFFKPATDSQVSFHPRDCL